MFNLIFVKQGFHAHLKHSNLNQKYFIKYYDKSTTSNRKSDSTLIKRHYTQREVAFSYLFMIS